jgi:predicted enzyme related to lactoylglutathione lyase
MSAQTVMAIYEAFPGQDEKLRSLIARHAPTLRREGLLSDRPEQIYRVAEGVYFELVEWKSDEAAKRAHDLPSVLAVWGSFEGVAHLRALGDLPAAVLRQPFPKFEAVSFTAPAQRGMDYSDNMLSARNFAALSAFYRDCFGLYVASEAACHVMLVDPVSQQKLCITDGESVSRMSPGIRAENLDEALDRLQAKGAVVRKRWEFEKMKGANCEDPEGNELLVWQEIPR